MTMVCRSCGEWIKPIVNKGDGNVHCTNCNNVERMQILPLFIVTGASGAGKTIVGSALRNIMPDFDVFETDILYKRFEILKRTSELLLEHKEDLAMTITGEAGKTYKESLIEIERTSQTFEIAAEEAKRIHGEGIPVESSPGAENRMAFTHAG